jgi:CRISPR/Cas system CSM-associated protein Csm3 (group 7 of RAMP superfamily)
MVNNMSNMSVAVNNGKIRTMVARWIVTGEMRLETAAHFGGEGESLADMKLLRDSLDGVTPLFPGTSLAGALRSHLADVLGGYFSNEDKDVTTLFGASRKNDDDGAQSPLIVFDSLGELPDGLKVEIRDGVSINSATGTAEPHKKFDIEVLPAGTIFRIRVELIVEKTEEEPKLVALLVKALDGLARGQISLGMRRSRGLGAVNARNWKARRFDFDLTTSDGWVNWLTSDHINPLADEAPFNSLVEAIESTCPALRLEEIHEDKRARMVIDVDFLLEGDLLVRSPGCESTAPDSVHLHSAGKPVLPGTSLAGVMRVQALRIARCVRSSQKDGDEWINQLFGPHIENKQNSSVLQPSVSKLRVSENFVSHGTPHRQTRIAIDRFTGGVVSGALFDEEVQAGGKINVRLELRKPTEAEIGLILLLLKDLLSGEIPVGGSASVGRGVLKGTAKLFLDNGKQYNIGPDLQVQKDVMDDFNSFIRNFRDAESLITGEALS